ncbi:MAG TPA: DMT family transporter [Nocardioides sp.]|nr:DMT family transporter [Nocardioides sp.]
MTLPEAEPSRALKIAAIPLMLAGGAAVAGQSQINGRLAAELGGGTTAALTAALISFGTGLVLVSAIALSSRSRRAGIRRVVAAVREGRLRGAVLLAGLFGGFVVASQGITVATIGVALFSVAITAGQSSASLAVDQFGLGPGGHLPWSVPRAIAAAFAIVAVCLTAGERLVEDFSWKTALFALLPLLAGAGAAVQTALNGRISQHAGPWVTSLNNFIVGTVGLLLVWLVCLLRDHDLEPLPHQWWLYLGGAIGLTFIWLAAALVRVHGVLVLALCMIAGQVIGAEVIELASGDAHIGPLGIAGGGLVLLGVVVAFLRRPAGR